MYVATEHVKAGKVDTIGVAGEEVRDAGIRPPRCGLMICPVCRLEVGLERRAGELALTWSAEDWSKRCLSRDLGDPVLCKNLGPAIRELLSERKVRATEDK